MQVNCALTSLDLSRSQIDDALKVMSTACALNSLQLSFNNLALKVQR